MGRAVTKTFLKGSQTGTRGQANCNYIIYVYKINEKLFKILLKIDEN